MNPLPTLRIRRSGKLKWVGSGSGPPVKHRYLRKNLFPTGYGMLWMLIRIRIGIKTMPIHMRILHQVLHKLAWAKFFTFIHSNASLQCFSFLISGKCVKILGTLDSILKFSRHNTGVGHRTTGSQLCSNISFKRKTVSKTKRFLAHIQVKFITFHKGTDKDLQSRFFTL